MKKLIYTPDKDLKVHEEGAIRLICKSFQSHENGLPEWLKNSADAYAREDASEKKRIMIVIFSYGDKNLHPSISCLDFAGMTSEMIENNFRIWADPEAAIRGGKAKSVQGGHGNGGKCYMTQMFEDHALIHTVKNIKGNRYGVIAGSVNFGYIPDRDTGRDFEVTDLKTDLRKALSSVGCSLSKLPGSAYDALNEASGFTLITGFGPKGYGKKFPTKQLIHTLQEHPQMIRTIQLCNVFIIDNNKAYNRGKCLSLPDIQPIAGAEEPRLINIPEELKDPSSEELISTNEKGSFPVGSLKLKTSDVSMRWSRKARHNIIYIARSGYIGYRNVLELDVQSPYRDRIYGECNLEALEPFKQNERGSLANSPLTRALESFISEKIDIYAKEFEVRDRRRYNQEEKNAISKMNQALDKWKNQFLKELMRGMWGAGEGPGRAQRDPPLPSGKPEKMEIMLTHQKSGLGVSFRPTIKCFDELGRRIRLVPFRWVSEDNNIAMVDEDLMVINTFSYGSTSIYAETLDGKLFSNKVPIEVVRIHKINIFPKKLDIGTGTRHKLEAICRLANGEETNSVYLVWLEDNVSVARVSSSGLVFGISHGETKVEAGDDKCISEQPAIVRVSPEGGKGRGDKYGQGYPLVLITQNDVDPETNDEVVCSSEDPPVYQRPQDADRNIWWINSSAPLAQLYLDTSKGYGYQSREWRMYHLERYIDVIVQIALINSPSEKQSLSVNDWIMEWGAKAAEIQSAAAADLSEFLLNGTLPRE